MQLLLRLKNFITQLLCLHLKLAHTLAGFCCCSHRRAYFFPCGRCCFTRHCRRCRHPCVLAMERKCVLSRLLCHLCAHLLQPSRKLPNFPVSLQTLIA